MSEGRKTAGMSPRTGMAILAALFVFGFLALMAWTGGLARIDMVKAEVVARLVDQAVAMVGRAGASVLFAAVGLLLAFAFYATDARAGVPNP